MVKQKSKHEQEYIHIKKETLVEIGGYLVLGSLILILIGFIAWSSQDYGYNKGFQEGYLTGINDTVETVFNFLDKNNCNTDLVFTNNQSRSITVQKTGCGYFKFEANPNLLSSSYWNTNLSTINMGDKK